MRNLLTEIRPPERRATFSTFLTLFGIMAGHAILETARDALFLARIPATRLPWVYLLIAAISLGIFALQSRSRRAQSRTGLSLWLLASAAVTLGLWFLLAHPRTWILYAIYTWTGVFTTLVVVRFWILAGDLFTVTQAKRLFAFIGAGSVLGAIVGSGLARILTMNVDARSLLLAAAAIFAAVAACPLLLGSRGEPGPGGPSPARDGSEAAILRPIRTILDRPYLRRVAGIVLISTTTLTLVDFLFKLSVARAVAPGNLAAFFATVYLGLNLLSLLVQILLVGWIIRRVRINRVLSLLPGLILGAAGAVVLGGGLLAALALKGIDGALRHSLHRTATEVLYVPLTGDLRTRVKGFMDVIGQRGGQAAASLIALGITLLGSTEVVLGALILLLSGGWIWLARSLKDHYLNLFRQTLDAVTVNTQLEFPQLDLASLETLFAALNSPNDQEVLATLDLLTEQGRTRLIPALILYHPSSRVVIRALELFTAAGRDDFVPITDRLLEHRDPEVRAAVLRARSWTAPSPELFEEFATDPSPIVRASALIGMVSYGSSSAAEARTAIESIPETGLPEEQLALARAIRFSPGAGYEETLLRLGRSDNPRVLYAVILAMQEILSYRFIPRLLELLVDRNLRGPARSAIVAMGAPVLEELDRALDDDALDRGIRRQIPRVMSEFPGQEAADILMRHLLDERDGSVRYRILRALGRLVALDPGLRLEPSRLEKEIDNTLQALYRLLDWRLQLEAGTRIDPSRRTPIQGLIVALLEHKQALALERLFRLLGLVHAGEDLRQLYRGMRSRNRQVRDSSHELLENLLRPPIREQVLALVDDLPDRARLDRVRMFYPRPRLEYEDVLRILLERGGVGTRCLVAYHAGELRLKALGEDLRRLERDPEGMIERAVERALARWQPTPAEVPDGN